MFSSLILLISTAVLVYGDRQIPILQGVDPKNAAIYTASEQGFFKCLDGSSMILFDAVNDDYCDCIDGSDEPGTSACPNGQYFCENKGFKSINISNTKVNDGVCDEECCDGSDEYLGYVECKNQCSEYKLKMQKKSVKDRAKIAETIEIKKSYIRNAMSPAKRKSELDNLKTRLQKKNDDIERLQRESIRKEGLLATEKTKANQKTFSKEFASKVEKYEESIKEMTARYERMRSKYNALVDVVHPFYYLYSQDGTEKKASERTLIDKDTSSELVQNVLVTVFENWEQMSNDFDFAFENESFQFSLGQDLIHSFEEEIQPVSPCAVPNESSLNCMVHSVIESSKTILSEMALSIFQSIDYFELSSTKTAEDMRVAITNLEREKSVIESSIEDFEEKLKFDFGPDGAFEEIYNECFSLSTNFKYELCFMATASHTDKNSYQNKVGLGEFTRWGSKSDSNEVDYTVQIYENGDSCQNKKRSTVLHLECANQNILLSVTEPVLCEYEMRFSTPAVCEESLLHQEL